MNKDEGYGAYEVKFIPEARGRASRLFQNKEQKQL